MGMKWWRVRRAIVRWLGPAYSGRRDMGANPDYYSHDEVEALITALKRIVR